MNPFAGVFLGFATGVGLLAATQWWFPWTLPALLGCGVFIGWHLSDIIDDTI